METVSEKIIKQAKVIEDMKSNPEVIGVVFVSSRNIGKKALVQYMATEDVDHEVINSKIKNNDSTHSEG